MTMFHFFNCAILTFGPDAVYYSATPLLVSYDTIGTLVKTALVYLVMALVKLVCLATFLNVSESDIFYPSLQLLLQLKSMSNTISLIVVDHFLLLVLSVPSGCAFADSVLHRLAPLWVGARGLEFTWDYVLQGLEANTNLMLSLSLAALGSLMWLRKNKPNTLIPIIYAFAGIVATMPSITSYLRWGLGWNLPEVVSFQLITSLILALLS
ncbi:uncharacterized protein [Rutidosis leptorrhynchoides]|uniref:uncharacterized protein n=1 Tax=Rutidosis leptorrhynchoides TaxID=125765 RepID=UPI003A98F64B